MKPLEKSLRNRLEQTIKNARETAETAAGVILEQLGVGQASPFIQLNDAEKSLRRRLRVHGRQLGDRLNGGKGQSLDRLVEEIAYEHWHRMLFARFLAENNLLMYWPAGDDEPIDIPLETCQDLIDEGSEPAGSMWELAARFAARMLPRIFRPDSPVFDLSLPPEHQQKLERLVGDLPPEVFTASDSLGWVYQFWQAKRKGEINASEVKIGARELPAVTQLFTESYMVSFLLDNALGAWWAARRLSASDLKNAGSEEELRHRASIPGVPLNYLRLVKVEAASSRLKKIGYFHQDDSIDNLSGNLPHWRQEDVTYFVTFRTADSLPQDKLNYWRQEKEDWLALHPEPHDEKTRREFQQKFPERFQAWLDLGYGECLLRQPELKKIIEDALRFFDGERYDLDEFVIMPNHVHILVTPRNGYTLSDILHSWKSFTAKAINRKTGKSGAFWQKESFDHIVRSPAQLEKIRQYIKEHCAYEENKRQDAVSAIWVPAAGTFAGWPESLSELKVLDPCCGSGHFLVAAFLMLVPMRMELEGLSAREAVDAVLRDNLHGLEIDQRCVELAAFALALAAWKYPGAGGYRPLPGLNVACSGLAVSAKKEEWLELAGDDDELQGGLAHLHQLFQQAPMLGSLINPAAIDANYFNADYSRTADLLDRALRREDDGGNIYREMEVVAQGLARAATLLAGRYHLVVTNVPYLARGKQGEQLREFCAARYQAAKNDLATVFLDRCLEFCELGGTVSAVLPQNWLFLTSYRKLREKLLKNETWQLLARLGPGAFETISGEVVKAILLTLSRGNGEEASWLWFKKRQDAASTLLHGLDVSAPRTAAEKAAGLLRAEIKSVEQKKQLENPDARVALEEVQGNLLEKYGLAYIGQRSGDGPRFIYLHWEFDQIPHGCELFGTTVNCTVPYSGNTQVFLWEEGKGQLAQYQAELARTQYASGGWKQGWQAWGVTGIRVSQMRVLPVTIHCKPHFDNNTATIVPHNPSHLPAIWCFCSSPEYNGAVRQIDQSLKVTNATLVKVPFDLDHWTKVAQEKYPHGLPKPYTDDPTQWIFHGHPCGSVTWNEKTKRLEAASTMRTDATVLQVVVARMLGYCWPAELESRSGFQPLIDNKKSQNNSTVMELADEQREWVNRCESLLPFADEDGIVCIPPVRGEAAADDRLLNLLAAAYGETWSSNTLSRLLTSVGYPGKTLENWLREKFFTQHCKLFHHRPFIWHIWDGLPDGFAALVNYHKLDYKLLETLIYTYLGDWLSRQKQDIANGIDGAREKLAAAENLKKKLELILAGEEPYDIFIRWKPIEQQPLGWHPDLNDGVRLNIRPFMTVADVKKKGAGILRDKPNIHWKKDRGKDVASAPWYHLGLQYGGKEGDRINDHHLTLAEKHAARGVT